MLTDDEIVKARHHMGYPNVSAVATYSLGIPAAMQTTFMIEGALVRVLFSAEKKFRELLDKLDRAECKVEEVLDAVVLSKAEDVEYNQDALKKVATVYKLWQQSMANMLGIVPNPFDQREWLGLGEGGGVNVPVVG